MTGAWFKAQTRIGGWLMADGRWLISRSPDHENGSIIRGRASAEATDIAQ